MTAFTVLPGPERRRRWTTAEKLRIVEESLNARDHRCRICAAARPSSQFGAHLALAGAQGNAVRDFEWRTHWSVSESLLAHAFSPGAGRACRLARRHPVTGRLQPEQHD